MTNTTPLSAGETPAAPPDPWTKVERLYLCRHCGRAVGRARLTFSGGLHCDSCDEVCDQPIAVMYATAVEHTAATERQHHAADAFELEVLREERDLRVVQLAQKDAEILKSHTELGEAGKLIEAIDADLTAARAEIARLTKEPNGDIVNELHEIFTVHGIASRLDFPSLTTHIIAWAAKHQRRDRKRAEAAEASLLALQQQMGEKDAHLDLVRDTANGWQANYAEKDAELLALRTDRSRWEAQHDRQVETILALRAAHAQLREQIVAAYDVFEQEMVDVLEQRENRHSHLSIFANFAAPKMLQSLKAALAASPPHPETEGP